jgi:hypothetical protein
MAPTLTFTRQVESLIVSPTVELTVPDITIATDTPSTLQTSPSALVVASSSLNGSVWDGQIDFYDAHLCKQLAVTTWSGCTDVCWVNHTAAPTSVVVACDDGSILHMTPSKIDVFVDDELEDRSVPMVPSTHADSEPSITRYAAHNAAVLSVATPTVASPLVCHHTSISVSVSVYLLWVDVSTTILIHYQYRCCSGCWSRWFPVAKMALYRFGTWKTKALLQALPSMVCSITTVTCMV